MSGNERIVNVLTDSMERTSEALDAVLGEGVADDEDFAHAIYVLARQRDGANDELARLRARVQEQREALRAAHLGLVPNLNHPLGHCFGTAHRDFTTTWEEVEPEQRCFVCAAIYAVHGALVDGEEQT